MKDITSNKHGGNAESVASYETISQTLTERQYDVLNAFFTFHGGMTSKDVAAWLGLPLNAISGRISELKAMGKIQQIGRRDGCGVYVANL